MQSNHRLRPVLAVASLLALPAAAGTARAERAAYQTDKSFGLGIMLGAPSGLSGKYFLGGSRTALAFGAGLYHDYDCYYGYDRRSTEAHLDFLFHPVVLVETPGFALPLYVGVGGRILDHEGYDFMDDRHVGHTHLGVRVPVGVSFDLRRAPLDIFAELVPVLDLTGDHDYYDEHRRFDLTFAIGLRYFF